MQLCRMLSWSTMRIMPHSRLGQMKGIPWAGQEAVQPRWATAAALDPPAVASCALHPGLPRAHGAPAHLRPQGQAQALWQSAEHAAMRAALHGPQTDQAAAAAAHAP